MAGLGDHCLQVVHGLYQCMQNESQCDVSLRCATSNHSWKYRRCHSSVLAAVSPLLKNVLSQTDLDDEVVIVSEIEIGPLLDLFYTGMTTCASKAEVDKLSDILSNLGIVDNINIVVTPSQTITMSCINNIASGDEKMIMHIVLGVDHEEENLLDEVKKVDLYNSQQLEGQISENSITSVKPITASCDQETNLFQCDECFSKFTTETSIRSHIADVHAAVKCHKCDLTINGSVNLVEHTKNIHSIKEHAKAKNDYQAPRCNICHESFVTNQALKFHLYKHSGLKPFKCTICSASFRTPSTLKSHVEVQHTESKHRCALCGLKSSTSGKLKIHMRTHTNEKPYQCTFCPNRFKQLSVLRVHEFTHTKKSKYKCDRCGNFFPTKNRLISHNSKPVCISRTRGATSYKKYRSSKNRKLSVLDELGSHTAMEGVTYLIQNESANEELPLQQLDQDDNVSTHIEYEPPLSSYQSDTLDTLETDEIPVLVDNLPVIIQTDIDRHRLEGGIESSNEQIMFNL